MGQNDKSDDEDNNDEKKDDQKQDDSVEKFHNLAQPSADNGPQGYNNDPNCLSSCCSGEKNSNPQCSAVTTFTNELNAQGLNCPMGFDGNHVGSSI